MAYKLRLEVTDFRAIGHADIILDGITVIAGENGAGKSTISKLLYHTIKVVNEYDSIVDEQLKSKLRRISSTLRDVLRDYSYVFEGGETKYEELNKLLSNAIQLVSSDIEESKGRFVDLTYETLSWIFDLFKKIQNPDFHIKIRTKLKIQTQDIQNHIERINKSLKSVLPTDEQNEISDSDLDAIFNKLTEYVESLYAECNDKKYNRYIDELSDKLKRQFAVGIESVNYNIYEYGINLIEWKLNKIYTINQLDNVIYIDTPMAFGALSEYDNNSRNEHWTDLNKLLIKESYSINDTFSNQIIHGSARYERSELLRNKFIFKRDDGKEFNLLEVATGVKSFSVLQMLLNNGSLNEKSLLIIDEPEAHLHPQWIFEYARFLVVLHKQFGVKLLIASHSPDMVSAIKYISEKESLNEKLNFYLAEQKESEYKYYYRHLGLDIDDIFDSYNKFYGKLDSYIE